MLQTLKRGNTPAQWDVSAFLSAGSIRSLLKSLEGLKADVHFIDKGTIEIRHIDVTLANAFYDLDVEVALVGLFANTIQIEVLVNIRAYLALSQYSFPDGDGSPWAIFKMIPLRQSIAPRLGSRSAQLSPTIQDVLLQTIQSGRAYEAFFAGISLPVPLHLHKDLSLGGTRQLELNYNHGRSSTTIEVRAPVFQSIATLALEPPVLTSDGIWVFASSERAVLRPPLQHEDLSDGQVRDSLRRIDRELDPLVRSMKSPDTDIALWISDHSVAPTVAAFNHDSGVKREVPFVSVRNNGKLVDKIDHVARQRYGYSVGLSRVDGAHGSLRYGQLRQGWIETRGISLELDVSTHADVDLELFVDPLVGGGMTTAFTITGDASHTFAATFETQLITVGTHKAITFGPILTCGSIPISLKGGGAVEFGAIVNQTVGTSSPKPAIVVSSLPEHIALTNTAMNTDSISFPNQWLQLVFDPKSAGAENHQYTFTTNLFASRITEPLALQDRKLRAESLEKEVAAIWAKTNSPSCEPNSDVTILFAGVEFSPSNEFYKAVANMIHVSAVTVERAQRVLKNPSEAPGVAKETLVSAEAELKRGLKKAKRFIRKLRR